MSTLAYLDCVGGLAGDMLLAALLDAGAPRPVLDDVPGALGLDRVTIDAERVTRAGVASMLVRIVDDPSQRRPIARPARDLRAIVERSSLSQGVRDRSLAALDVLACAEAEVHGEDPDRVILHELSGVDTLVDVCGTFALLDAMGIERVTCSPLPYAGRSRPSSHVHLPGPGPAVLRILRDAPWVGVDAPDELVTPTGAAIVAVAAQGWGELPAMTLADVGYGAGSRDPIDRANVLRIVVGAPMEGGEDASFGTDRVVLLEANVDDMIPELVPDAMQACRSAGALDAWSAPIHMKKGRPGLIVSAIARPHAERDVVAAMLEHTSTLGVRVTPLRRYELDRGFEVVQVHGHDIRVKIGRLGGRVVNVAPEHDDCAAVASRTGIATKRIWAEALVATARVGVEAGDDPAR